MAGSAVFGQQKICQLLRNHTAVGNRSHSHFSYELPLDLRVASFDGCR